MSSLLQYFSIYYETLRLYNITIFSNQTWLDLNLQYSLMFSVKTRFFNDVNTSAIKCHTSNMFAFQDDRKEKKKEYKSKSP